MTARLHIRTACRNGKTYLQQAYQEPPFKVADITEDAAGNTLQLMLMNASPGVLDGDRYHIELELQEGSSLQLHTQSYQRLYTMKTTASQRMDVHLHSGASLHYIPHPVVPHKASDFLGVNKIYIAGRCELIWAEVLTCGRKGSGETFSYTRFQSITEIFHNGKLVIRENLLLVPAAARPDAIGTMEGFTHQASLICWKGSVCSPAVMEGLHTLLQDEPGTSAGISSVCPDALVIRLLGYKAEQLFNLVKTAADFIIKTSNADKKTTLL